MKTQNTSYSARHAWNAYERAEREAQRLRTQKALGPALPLKVVLEAERKAALLLRRAERFDN